MNNANDGRTSSLADVDITSELAHRPSRPPDYQAESQALVDLASVMATDPHTILQKLAETALALCQADSSGISILESDGQPAIFRWHATAGRFGPFLGETTPRDFSPCGIVLDRNATQLMTDPARFYPYIAELSPHVAELLLLPFYHGNSAVGTIWVVAHSHERKFDAEDKRLLMSLGKFASTAIQVLRSIEAGKQAETEITRLREEERAANGRAVQILESVTDAFVALDRGWRFTYLNPQAETLLQRTRGELLGEVIWQAFPQTIGTRFEQEYRAAVAERRPVIFQEYYPPPLNDWVEVHAYPSEDGLSIYFQNITARKQAEHDRERLMGQLQEHDQQKNDFLATLAHELRNPLAAISNAVSLLSISEDEEDRDYSTEAIRRQTSHLSRLVDDLLDISRINLGKIELRQEILDATPILESAIQTVKNLVEERQHSLEVTIQRNALWVNADPTRLEQIVTNLLNNAAKYSKNGGSIRLSAGYEGSEIFIRVQDAGIGIAPEKLRAIFQLYHQADHSSARSEGGLGIGLTIVKRLVEALGGQITASSEGLGRGSEFTVRLPAAARPKVNSPPTENSSKATGKAHVLVVDDNADTVRGLALLLNLAGHDVKTARNGPEAIAIAGIYEPQFILLDLGLPGMSGYDVALRLREHEAGKATRIVAISGYGQEEDRRRTRAAGFDHHLVKPVNYEELLGLLGSKVP
jgi:signal transduction histidine kinase/ActR/RegA family two-component response regulator